MKLPPYLYVEEYFNVGVLEYYSIRDPWLGHAICVNSNNTKYIIPWPKTKEEFISYLQQHYPEILI